MSKETVTLGIAATVATGLIVWFATGDAEGRSATAKAKKGTNPPMATTAPAEPAKAPVPAPPPSPKFHPAFTTSGTLAMEGRLGHPALPAKSDSETFVSFAIKADAAAPTQRNSRLGLSIAIDRSGSMKGKRHRNAIEAAKRAVLRLRAGDVVNVVSYNTKTTVVVPNTVVSEGNRARILRSIARIRVGGDTCISCGIETGRKLLSQQPLKQKSILVLSDGQATHGVRDVAGFQKIGVESRDVSVAVTTIGVDLDYNEELLAAVSRESNGRHYFVQNPAALAAVFDKEMGKLGSTVATGARLAVQIPAGVMLDKVFDRAFTLDGNRILIPMGDFAAGETKTLLLRLRVPEGPAGARPIAKAELGYEDVALSKKTRSQGVLVAEAREDMQKLAALDGLVSNRVSRSETKAALDEANAHFRSGNAAGARKTISLARTKLKKRRAAAPAPAAGRAAEQEAGFGDLASSLDKADKGFDQKASKGAGKARSKKNAEDAFRLSL